MHALSHGQPIASNHFTVVYHVAGYFNGVLIFIIFVVNPAITTFSTHKNFHPQKFPPTKISTHTAALSTHAKIRTSNVSSWLFFAACTPLTVPLIHRVPSQAVPCVVIEEVNREMKKAEAQPKNGASTSHSPRK